ncbi:MAG: ABC transporter ATP-binding protein [bacterium]|nr:ABC transporter ATP-binding protein [bacterium]
MHLLWRYLKQYKKILIGTLLLATINTFFSLLDPQIFRLLIDNYATRVGELSSQEFFSGVILLLLGTVGVALVSRTAKTFQDYYVNVVEQRLGTKMYATSVSHSFSLPYSVFEDQRSGEFLDKLQKARTDAQLLIKNFINVLFLSVVGIVFVLAYAFYVHWMIGLVYFLIIPTLGGTIYFISRRIKKSQELIIQETASLAGSTTETIRNVELVKSLGLEEQEIRRLNDVNEKILQLELKKVKLIRTLSFIQGTLVNGLRSALMLLMLWLVFYGGISLGEFFSLLFYSFAVFNPLAEFAVFATTYQEARASMARLDNILKIKPEEQLANAVTLDKVKKINFVDVGFRYNTETTPAVNDINVEIKSGQTVAFVGPSGSGKTTIVKLLVGLYRPTEGAILFNDTNSKELNFQQLRSKLGLVSQDTQLFAGTIRENLLFASPGASDEECVQALTSAAALTVVNRGSEGLDAKIGEGGLKLSGGEKQRLAIARALLRKPELIIFDEATSSLDSLTEEQITQTIKSVEHLTPDLITVLIAHRLSTVAHADVIYVLEKGKIVEKGSHDELLELKGLYAALWRNQIAVK